MKNLLPLLLLYFAIISCVDCGPQGELSINIEFRADSLHLDSVAAVNALDQQAFQRQVLDQLTFPMSLVADSTTYIFFFKSRTDTLTIFYAREFRYKGSCGFIVNAHQPASGDQVHTTFKKAEVTYGTYVDSDRSTFPSGPNTPGIRVSVTP